MYIGAFRRLFFLLFLLFEKFEKKMKNFNFEEICF